MHTFSHYSNTCHLFGQYKVWLKAQSWKNFCTDLHKVNGVQQRWTTSKVFQLSICQVCSSYMLIATYCLYLKLSMRESQSPQWPPDISLCCAITRGNSTYLQHFKSANVRILVHQSLMAFN